MTTTNGIISPTSGKHLKNIHTGEIYPGEIIPAKSLSVSDFVEVDESEYQAYLAIEEEITDTEALAIITGGVDV